MENTDKIKLEDVLYYRSWKKWLDILWMINAILIILILIFLIVWIMFISSNNWEVGAWFMVVFFVFVYCEIAGVVLLCSFYFDSNTKNIKEATKQTGFIQDVILSEIIIPTLDNQVSVELVNMFRFFRKSRNEQSYILGKTMIDDKEESLSIYCLGTSVRNYKALNINGKYRCFIYKVNYTGKYIGILLNK